MPQLNQAYKESLAILVRQGLIALGTSLGISGFLTPYLGQLTNDVVGLLVTLLGVGWAQISQQFKRSKLMQALQEAETTEQAIAGKVKSTMIPTPSVTTPTNEVPQ